MTAKKFFLDNTNRVTPAADPLEYNLNSGLFQLAKQIEDMQNTLRHLQNEVAQVHRDVRNLQR